MRDSNRVSLITATVLGIALCGAPGCGGEAATQDAGAADAARVDAAGIDVGTADLGVTADVGTCPDRDRDGVGDEACGGGDCDDNNPLRYPGNAERCDQTDEDCDPGTLGPDRDTDGYVGTQCCNPSATGPARCGTDCDDDRSGVHPGTPEACNGVDDDCSGTADEGVQDTYYRDRDGDLYGDDTMTMRGCTLPVGWALRGGDGCALDDPTRHPGTREICNSMDDDCDGNVDGDCTELCNGRDDDMDGAVDEAFECVQLAELTTCTTACGLPGTGMCTALCGRPTGSACRSAAEVCNYCDDNGVAGTDDERAAALGLPARSSGAIRCADLRLVGGALCEDPGGDTDQFANLVRASLGRDRRAIWHQTPFVAGHGPTTFEVTVLASGPSNGAPPGDAWALVIATGGTGDLETRALSFSGLPTTREGMAVEWRFFESTTTFGDGPDVIAAYRLDPRCLNGVCPYEDTSGQPVSARAPASAWLGVARRVVGQTLRVTVTPDAPEAGDQSRLLIEARDGAVFTRVLELLPDPSGTTEGFNSPLVPGQRFAVGIVSGTGGQTASVDVHLSAPPTGSTPVTVWTRAGACL